MNTKLLNIVYILTLFVRSFGFLQGASLRSSKVVQVVRRTMDDWPATPQGSKRNIKTSLFSGEPVNLRNLFLRNKANFNHSNITATSYVTVVYDTSQTKPKNGANPNKANLKPISKKEKPQLSGDPQAKNKKMQSKPNFKNQENSTTTYSPGVYINSHSQTHKKSKPNPKPIQTQFQNPQKHLSGILGTAAGGETYHWCAIKTVPKLDFA